jgi:hypothetical protein
MNLSKSRLKQIILEELQRSLNEQEAAPKRLSKGRMRIMANALCFGDGQKVIFRDKAGKPTSMGAAKKDTSWRCPGNKNLGYKDWSDARKLARGDSEKFQQFIQSKKGGAGRAPEPKVEAVVAAWVKAWKERAKSESAKKAFMERLKKYAQTGSDIMKQAAPLIFKQIEEPGGQEGTPGKEGGFMAEIQKYIDLFNNLGNDKQRKKDFLTTLENSHSDKEVVRVFLALRKHIEFYMGIEKPEDKQMVLQKLIDEFKSGFPDDDAVAKLAKKVFLQLPAIKQAIEAIKAAERGQGPSTAPTEGVPKVMDEESKEYKNLK